LIPGGLYLADTSALARAGHPQVHAELDRLGRLGLLASCATVDLEVLYSARSTTEYATIAQRRDLGFTDLPLHADIGMRAKQVQAELAKTSQHRAAGVVDLLTAAIAEHHAAIVLHYDRDFEHIARVTRQQTQWVVPSGTAG
jgi:predicted nucleic acid-binding protein